MKAGADMIKAVRLKVNHLINPIGINFDKIRFYWNVQNAIRQSAYQIVVTDDNENIVWDSKKTTSSDMTGIISPVKPVSRQRLYWTVILWDESDNKGEKSDTAFFETGLKNESDWSAKWITGDYAPNKKERYPVDCFKKTFNVKDMQKARLYISACGIYSAYLNDKRIGSNVLAPGITDYNKRIYYQTYDVTDLLIEGENTLEVFVADGWYRGSVGGRGTTYQYGKETKFISQLEIYDKKGMTRIVISDRSWSWSNDGPVRFADNKDGEIYDANKIPTYDKTVKITSHKIVPTASNNNGMVKKEAFNANILKTPSDETVLDFSQNIAGFIRFNIQAKKGDKLVLHFGEMLDRTGEFTQSNIQLKHDEKITPLQKLEYTCKQGINEYETEFSIMGFRYVLIETGENIKIDAKDFKAIFVYTDMEQTLAFDSSNVLLNKFTDAVIMSAKGNHADLPTDCPTRERLGWTGDAQIFCKTAAYLFDYHTFAKKYLHDIYDQQKKNGCLPVIAPEGGIGFFTKMMDGSAGWADAGVIIPYVLWKQYGDTAIIEEFYEKMKKYATFLQKRCGKISFATGPTGLKRKDAKYLSNSSTAFGEWSEPKDVFVPSMKDLGAAQPEVSTAYTAHVMDLMSQMAQALGKDDDAKSFDEFKNNNISSYRALVKTDKYSLDTDRQARLVRPLAFNLLDKEQSEYAKDRLIKALDNYRWRIGTGFLSTPLILDVLSDIDIEHAYRLLENKQMPGWLFMVKNGATTVWEDWEGTRAEKGIASLNHYSKGAVCAWLFSVMCGISIKGKNSFTIAPRPGGTFLHAKTEYTSIYGKVISGWQKHKDKTVFTITIPPNTKAEVILPDNTKTIQYSGTVEYEIDNTDI